MYLLDTNSVIYFFKGIGNIAHNLFKHSPKEIFIPSIVVYN
jgi:tRNA(fMet)-specific endonuclease VapC